MKKRRKTESCLNCGYKLDTSFEFCPACGQENTDNQISFGRLVSEFFSNYFSLDSRFGRSIFPFFFKPGTLTREFMDGKRVKYANPIRLYLVVSLIHFFIMNVYLDSIATHGKIFSTDEKNQAALDSLVLDPVADSLIQAEIKPMINVMAKDTAEKDQSDNWPMSDQDWKTIYKMSQKSYTVQDIEDSIHNESRPYMAQKINRQVIKIMSSDKHTLNMFIVKNIPMLMFFLLPLYALILKVFFRKKLYINHLIHGLHIHSLTFILLSLFWLTKLFSEDLASIIDFYMFLMICVYVVLSFRNTYQIKYRTAIFRVLTTGATYCFLLIFGMIIEVFLSLLFY